MDLKQMKLELVGDGENTFTMVEDGGENIWKCVFLLHPKFLDKISEMQRRIQQLEAKCKS